MAPRDDLDEMAGALAAAPPYQPPPDDPDGLGDGPPDNAKLARLPQSDLGNAGRLRARFGADLAYVTGEGWHHYDGKRYARERDDPPPAVMKLVHRMVRAIHDEAAALDVALKEARDAAVAAGTLSGEALTERAKLDRDIVASQHKWSIRSGNSDKIAGALKQARPYLTHDVEAMDADPFVVNLANGTLELFPAAAPAAFDGCSDAALPEPQLRDHDRADLITRLAPVVWTKDATGGRWEAFLRQMQPDDTIRLYLQRLAGYCATADNGEQVFAIHWGNGKNGKSTFVECITGVLGDYVQVVDPRVFMTNPNADAGKANPALAKLRGIRLVSASEPSEDSKLGEDLIKAVTGGGKIAVRDLFQAEKEYRPTWKLWFDTNFKPVIRGLDLGIWRRIHMVPWICTVPEGQRVKDYHKILLAEEGEAILRWIVEGARMWREHGLAPPPAVLEAVEEYKRESDPLFDFLEGATHEVDVAARGPSATELYTAYAWWSEQNGRTPMTDNAFGRCMTKRGRPSKKVEGIMRYKGLTLLPTAHAPSDYVPPRKHAKGGGGGGAGTGGLL
ncbi:hypothetical protein GAY33_05180 [Azospirillum brasilense]|uniref:DNA primase family protein n=1 Tax=Azospirillum argentinense TaxID=2970906 RepID=UPI00190CF055|nr:phage/plasmid primase, P4 family [Azospirillum argentinense]MBK3798629.1 hypothetical protein [Azospirillum argentinense]